MSFNEPEGPDPRDEARRRELERKQDLLMKQTEREKAQREAQAEKQRISLLRGRFGMGGAVSSGVDQASSSLFSRITGR